MTKYKCVFCENIIPVGAHYCATCNRIDGCNPIRTFIVEETYRHTVEAMDEDEAMKMVNDGVADCPAISITKVEEIKTFFAVNYSATYLVEADTKEEAIQMAIREHEEMPDGDWSAEETNSQEWEATNADECQRCFGLIEGGTPFSRYCDECLDVVEQNKKGAN